MAGHSLIQGLAALLLSAIGTAALGADQQLLLDVIVNGRATGKVGDFVLRDGVLLARPDDLRSLGLATPAPFTADGGDLLSLATLAGVSARIDEASQTLFLYAANESLVGTSLFVDHAPQARYASKSDVGATLDYDVTATTASGRTAADGLLDLRLFSPHGVASTGLIVRAGDGPGYRPFRLARLDTAYTISDRRRLQQYRFGDFITGALDWTRPVRLGGIQVIRHFDLQPDLVTFPVPSLHGSVAVPSTIDVLVNGVRQFSGDVEAGPFHIPQLPVVNGAGTVSTVISNTLGEQVTATLPFYASTSLLTPRLQAYSAQIGTVRRDWGPPGRSLRATGGDWNIPPRLDIPPDRRGDRRHGHGWRRRRVQRGERDAGEPGRRGKHGAWPDGGGTGGGGAA